MDNLFSVFELPASFDLDLADLEKRYFTVQRACHPDRFVGKPAGERQQAILHSMQANEAYDALKFPLTRARHMLALQGIQVGSEKDSVKPSHTLLLEIMELREALDDIKSPAEVQKLKTANEAGINALVAELSTAFAKADLQQAAQAAIKLGYLIKIEGEIRLKAKTVQA